MLDTFLGDGMKQQQLVTLAIENGYTYLTTRSGLKKNRTNTLYHQSFRYR